MMQDIARELGAEMFERHEAECKLGAAMQVAAEAMRLLTDEQLNKLRHRLDALESGEEQ